MEAIQLDVEGIKKYIKIRHPVLMLDGASIIPGVSAEGFKLLDGREEFWKGHYPEYPIMPGTYQLEALAQLFSLTFLVGGDYSGVIPKLVGFDKVRFFKEVKPAEGQSCLELSARLDSFRHGLAKGEAKGLVGGEIVCCAEIKTVIELQRQ